MKANESPKPQASGALCTAHNRRGEPCGKFAVNGWNVCRLHGAGGGRPATRPETILRKSLESNELRLKADALIENGVDVLDLRRIAAMLHVLAGELAENRSKGHQEVALLLQCLEAVRKVSESVERIRASKTFTTAEKDFLIQTLADFIETLPEIERPRLRDFIESRLLQNRPAPLPMASETV